MYIFIYLAVLKDSYLNNILSFQLFNVDESLKALCAEGLWIEVDFVHEVG